MEANEIIDAIGGTGEVARLCNVTTGAVSQWRTQGIPEARLMYLKLARPEVFKQEGENHGA
jgi:hypothetical protein